MFMVKFAATCSLMYTRFLLLLILLGQSVFAQKKLSEVNYVLIQPDDSKEEIIKKAANVTPSPRQYAWQLLELTGFLHYGINTFTDREWGTGKEDPKIFNPEKLDALQWVQACKDGGIRLIILTAKHHDGFCLWPSKYTEHSVKNSPWRNGRGDLVKEVADACRKLNVRFGIYLSPWDMNSPLYGTEEYNDFFINQLTELLTGYGQIDEVWFDGANGEGPNGKKQVYDFERYYKHIRKLQPFATIAVMGPDVRWVGTETGYGRETEWSVVPADNLNTESIAAGSQQEINFKPQGDMRGNDLGSNEKIFKAKGLVWYPAETDVSIRPGWFYHSAEDDKVKSPEKLLDIYFHSVGRNGVLLLNIPPDRRGLIHERDAQNLKEWKTMRDDIFRDNLLQKAKIRARKRKGIKSVVDGRYETYWMAPDHTILEFNWKKNQDFNVLSLQENIAVGQRVTDFYLEVFVNGNWEKVCTGTTAGYKRLISFDRVSTRKARLVIAGARLNPAISEIGLYNNSYQKESQN